MLDEWTAAILLTAACIRYKLFRQQEISSDLYFRTPVSYINRTDLLTERRIEHHEIVLDVVRNWVKGTSNRLVFVENVGRYALYDSDHQVQYSNL